MLHPAAAIAVIAFVAAPLTIAAQGVTTAGIRGTVTASDHRQPDAIVRVADEATGYTVEARVRNGRFLIQGLQPGSPYSVSARAVGYVPQRTTGVTLTLGELRELNIELTTAVNVPTVLPARAVEARRHEDGGTGTTVPNAWIDELPTLNRDLYDFVRLVPQISTKISVASPGLSAGGSGFRYNSFLINGVSERTLSGGVSGAFAGNKSVPLGAVQEYEVLLAPYDVRYGDFAGALINTVTKSGTNAFTGSVFAYGRNDRLRRAGDSTSIPYDRAQYGFTLGGPLIRNRLHFFVAPELQYYTYPADGPYAGQPPNASLPMRVSQADLSRFDAIMRSYGLTAGSAGAIENSAPQRNVFTRLDLALPEWNSRLVAWNNYGGSDDRAFSRINTDTFSLSSYQLTRISRSRVFAGQVLTALGRSGGGNNELLMSYKSDGQDPTPSVTQPQIRVLVPAVSGGGRVLLNSGSHETAQGGRFRSSSLSIKDNITLPFGARHTVTLGAEWEGFRVDRGAANGSYGAWSFASLEDFEQRLAERYDVRVDLKRAPQLRGSQYAAYVSDQWQPSTRLSITTGLRSDLLSIDGTPPYTPLVESIFGRRTDEMPRSRVELSPRVGAIWNLPGAGHQRLRGGAGVFTGRYPLAWAHAALSTYGVGGGLQCGLLGTSALYPPAFNPDYRNPPQTCAGGAPPRTDVNLLDPDLRMVRVARASIAYERDIVSGVRLTTEALGSRSLSDFAFQNINLGQPITTDRNGRVMYGTIGANGVASPSVRSNDFAEVIDLRNVSGNYAYQLSATLETDRSRPVTGSLSYTYSHVEDVQTPTRVNNRGTVAWSSARVNAGRDDDLTTTTTSANNIPHRVIVAGTWTVPWKGLHSELAFYYVGESGRPFTYTTFGASRRGDLNADGSNSNDPIFVPNSAQSTGEIRLIQPAQAATFESFIKARSCLNQQRGRIMDRNSCNEPWSNTTIASVRQTIAIGRHAFDAQLDAFNVLNLLNKNWGLRRIAATSLLEHLSQTGTGPDAQPVFALNPDALKWTTLPNESSFQLQLALRYRF